MDFEPVYCHSFKIPGVTIGMREECLHWRPVIAGSGQDGTLALRLVLLVPDRSVKDCRPNYLEDYSALVVLNKDGSERWRYECDLAPLSPFIDSADRFYAVRRYGRESSSLLQFTSDGQLLLEFTASGQITSLLVLETLGRIVLEVDTAASRSDCFSDWVDKHLLILDRDGQLLSSYRFPETYFIRHEQEARTRFVAPNELYLALRHDGKEITGCLQLE